MELPGFFDELDKLIDKYILLSADELQVIRELHRYVEERISVAKEIPPGMLWNSDES